jgi:hypothetical protein
MAGCAVTLASVLACGAPADEPIVLQDVGFMTPESVLHDATGDVYLVSNINGDPFAEDDNGFISRVSPAGEVLELKWIDGGDEGVTLNAPKGMAIAGGTLFVGDINTVRMYDRETGAPIGAVPVEGSTFVNDVAAGPDGTIYFTDSGFAPGFESSGTDAVYRLDDAGGVEALATGDALGRPNGVAADARGVWVVTFGANTLSRLDGGEQTDSAELPDGGLDGLAILEDGTVLVSSWNAQAVYHGPVGGPFEVLVAEVEAPADIGHDATRNRVMIPLFQSDVVRIEPLAR